MSCLPHKTNWECQSDSVVSATYWHRHHHVNKHMSTPSHPDVSASNKAAQQTNSGRKITIKTTLVWPEAIKHHTSCNHPPITPSSYKAAPGPPRVSLNHATRFRSAQSQTQLSQRNERRVVAWNARAFVAKFPTRVNSAAEYYPRTRGSSRCGYLAGASRVGSEWWVCRSFVLQTLLIDEK